MRRKNIDHRTWIRLIEAAGWKCPACGVTLSVTAESGRSALSEPNFPEVDHVVPLARGGADDASNWAILCRRCNRKKGAR